MKRPGGNPPQHSISGTPTNATPTSSGSKGAFKKLTVKGRRGRDAPVTVVDANGNIQYRCEVCRKLFNKNYNLRAHSRLHTGERPFRCEVAGCGKSFLWKSSLTSHRVTHAEPVSQTATAERTPSDPASNGGRILPQDLSGGLRDHRPGDQGGQSSNMRQPNFSLTVSETGPSLLKNNSLGNRFRRKENIKTEPSYERARSEPGVGLSLHEYQHSLSGEIFEYKNQDSDYQQQMPGVQTTSHTNCSITTKQQGTAQCQLARLSVDQQQTAVESSKQVPSLRDTIHELESIIRPSVQACLSPRRPGNDDMFATENPVGWAGSPRREVHSSPLVADSNLVGISLNGHSMYPAHSATVPSDYTGGTPPTNSVHIDMKLSEQTESQEPKLFTGRSGALRVPSLNLRDTLPTSNSYPSAPILDPSDMQLTPADGNEFGPFEATTYGHGGQSKGPSTLESMCTSSLRKLHGETSVYRTTTELPMSYEHQQPPVTSAAGLATEALLNVSPGSSSRKIRLESLAGQAFQPEVPPRKPFGHTHPRADGPAQSMFTPHPTSQLRLFSPSRSPSGWVQEPVTPFRRSSKHM